MHRARTSVPVLTVAAIALAGMAIGAANAQTQSQGSPTSSTGGVRAPLAPRIPSVQGVPSKGAKPIGISRKGTLLNRTGTLLPPTPSSRPHAPSPRTRPPVTMPTDGINRPVYVGPGYVAKPHNGGINHSPGLTVDGSYNDDNVKLKFHVGSGYTVYPWWKPWQYQTTGYGGHHGHHGHHHGHNAYWWYPWISGFNYNNYYNDYDYYDNRPVVYGQLDPFIMSGAASQAMLTAMAQQAITPPREPTTLERADALLAYGEASAAVELYKRYLEDAPDDAAIMRTLAIALFEDRRLDEAAAVLVLAYQKNPRLARSPISPGQLAADAPAMRRRVNSAVSYANRVRSGSSWLLVTVLVQAEGRDDVALRMAERAKEQGLDAAIASEFIAVLKR